MEVGKLYQTKELYWFLFPSLETAHSQAPAADASADYADNIAVYWSYELDCTVSYIIPSMFVLLEQDKEYCRVLTTNGELGWIILDGWCKDDIEEVKQ